MQTEHAFMQVLGAERIIDPIILPDHETCVGMIEVPGAGWRVATVSEGAVQQMSGMRALRLAQELEGTKHAKALHPFTSALRLVAKLVVKAEDAQRAAREAGPMVGDGAHVPHSRAALPGLGS